MSSQNQTKRFDGTIFGEALRAIANYDTMGGFATQVLRYAECCSRREQELPESLRLFCESWINFGSTKSILPSKYVTQWGDIYSDDDLMAY